MPTPPPPQGTQIEQINDFDGMTLRWMPPPGGFLKFLPAAFLIIWLCGWAFGFAIAGREIINNANQRNGVEWFLIIWLCGWSVGGIFGMYMLYHVLRPSLPESVTLDRYALKYDSGRINPFACLNFNLIGDPNRARYLGRALLRNKRQQVEVDRNNIDAIVLERVGPRQRLTFDHGADRIDIGEILREPDREWLAEVLKEWKDA